MIMTFTLRQLEIFAAVAREEHLTRAAERLHLTQSAASVALKELERSLGGPLFARIGRRLVLNDRGRMALPRAERLLADAAELADAARGTDEHLAGELVVGASSTIAGYLLPQLIGEFTGVHPAAEVKLLVGNTREIGDALLAGTADVGVIEGIPPSTRLEETLWLRDELVVIAAPGSALAGAQHVPAAHLAQERWIVREPGSGTRETLEAAFEASGYTPADQHIVGQTEAIKRTVEADLGVSALSRWAVARELAAGRLATVATDLKPRRWFRLITVRDRYISRLAAGLCEWLLHHPLAAADHLPLTTTKERP